MINKAENDYGYSAPNAYGDKKNGSDESLDAEEDDELESSKKLGIS